MSTPEKSIAYSLCWISLRSPGESRLISINQISAVGPGPCNARIERLECALLSYVHSDINQSWHVSAESARGGTTHINVN